MSSKAVNEKRLRLRDVELLEDGAGGVFFDFAMAGDAGDFAIGGV